MNDHFTPVGNPAPPRPRRPEALTSLTMTSRPLSRIALVPSQAPRLRAPSRPQSPWPYRFLKMRSLSSSIVLSFHRLQCGRPADRCGKLPVNLRPGLGLPSGDEVIENFPEALRSEVLVGVLPDQHHRRVDAGAET